jgi:hypothetical protein
MVVSGGARQRQRHSMTVGGAEGERLCVFLLVWQLL